MSSNEIKLFVIFSVLLLVNGHNPKRHWTLSPNVLVLDIDGKPGQYSLTCLESTTESRSSDVHRSIFWKKDGKDEPIRGNTLTVQLEESVGGGNYTCYREDRMFLNHTLVLLRDVAQTAQRDLKCTAQNYNGSFHCSFKYPELHTWTVALVQAERVEDSRCFRDAGGRSWTSISDEGVIHCYLDSGSAGISCQEPCPPAEEIRPLHTTVYIHNQYYLLERYYRSFSLTEIVQPDTVKIQRVNGTLAMVRYPDSWSTPHSFYPLIAEVAFPKRCPKPCGNRKLRHRQIVKSSTPGTFQLKTRKNRCLCMRTRDAVSSSQWSEWSTSERTEKKEK